MIISELGVKKKIRSKRSRLRRSTISPVLFDSRSDNNKGLSTALSVDSSSCSLFADEVSSKARKRKCDEVVGAPETTKKKTIDDAPFRRITRLYCRKLKELENERRGIEVEVSESSCVLSNSGAVNGETSSKLKKGSGNVKTIEPNDISRSEVPCNDPAHVCNASLTSGVINLKTVQANKDYDDVISFTSDVESCALAKPGEKRAAAELSDISKSDIVESNFNISNSESIVEKKPSTIKLDSDLACSEQLSEDDESEYSSNHEIEYQELQCDIFQDDSDLDFSDYTPSIFYDSGSEFSERSSDDFSPPSRTYSLFLEFSLQFSRSTFPSESITCYPVEEAYRNQSRFARFENDEDEESYRRFRERERRQKFLHDYAVEYLSNTECGDLVLQQRSQMVNWIVEQCTAKEFQQTTMFLGVGLFDRFLSRGFFKSRKNLQILGIACLALATRIEENQPYNSVRQKNFHIGSNVYSRCEVVAMEWLVQQILDFQCLLPTIYNFLWFYLKAARADAEVEKKARYLAVLALSVHEQLCYWPSTVAATVVILASLESHPDTSYQRVIKIHVRTKDNDLPDCIKSLESLAQFIS